MSKYYGFIIPDYVNTVFEMLETYELMHSGNHLINDAYEVLNFLKTLNYDEVYSRIPEKYKSPIWLEVHLKYCIASGLTLHRDDNKLFDAFIKKYMSPMTDEEILKVYGHQYRVRFSDGTYASPRVVAFSKMYKHVLLPMFILADNINGYAHKPD